MMRRLTAALALAVSFAACGDAGDDPVPPETLNARRGAFRQACAAIEIAQRAQDDVVTIEQVLANLDPNDPLAEINRVASRAALEFARAYSAHADLRAAAYAHLDSAVNYAPTTADSARYIQRAAAFTVRAPQPGTVEENVINSFTADLTEILANGNHRCNWDIPF